MLLIWTEAGLPALWSMARWSATLPTHGELTKVELCYTVCVRSGVKGRHFNVQQSLDILCWTLFSNSLHRDKNSEEKN